MHLRLVEVTEPEVAEIAALLPAGRLHANGKGLIPVHQGRRLHRVDVRRAVPQATSA